MIYDRTFHAFEAAQRIVDAIEGAGLNVSDPYSIIDAKYNELPEFLQWNYGCSRIVLWDDECDYVIKVALNKDYEKFCQHEVEVYAAAVSEGLDGEFAWCECYTEPVMSEDVYIPGVYVMEYIDCNEEAVSDSAWQYGYNEFCKQKGIDSSSHDATDEYNDYYWQEEDEMVLDYMESLMPTDYRRAFEVFMCKWWVTDVHTANVGFKGDKMVITDYAGWNW